MLKKTLSILGYIFLIAALGLTIRHFTISPKMQDGSGLSSEKLFGATLPDSQNIQRPLSSYKGKIVIVNFWATWCPPCREEMPELSALHQQYQSKSVQVLGLAIDDVETIRAFQQESPVSYPLLAADMHGMEIAASLGNNRDALPYTAIITPEGKVTKTFLGKVTKPMLDAAISDLLPKN